MDQSSSEFRHALRGAVNALKLCVSAFDLPLSKSEQLEFLADIEVAADKVASLLDLEPASVEADVR